MAKKKNEDPQIDELMDLLREEGSIKTPEEKIGDIPRKLPKEQKISRAVVLQSHILQRSLFEELENPKPNESGEIIYSKLPSLISEYDFRAYMLASQLTLSDQSYLFHNEDINSGFIRDESNLTKDLQLLDEKKHSYHNGHISVTLNELCRVGYGIPEGQAPSAAQRNNMRATIEAVDKTPIGVVYGNGDQKETYLIKIMGKYTRKEDGSETYYLVLNPIFTSYGKGYGIMMRGATTKLSQYLISKGRTGRGGKSAAHIAFLQLLSIQRGEEWKVSVGNLLQRLNLLEQYKKNKRRTLDRLKSIFEDFVGTGYIKEIPTITQDGYYIIKLNNQFKDKNTKKDGNTPT